VDNFGWGGICCAKCLEVGEFFVQTNFCTKSQSQFVFSFWRFCWFFKANWPEVFSSRRFLAFRTRVHSSKKKKFDLKSNLENSADGKIVQTPIRNFNQLLVNSNPEKVVKVSTAQVAIVNYALLKKDFPFLNNSSNETIDAWLISNTAYISEGQARQTIVNTSIASNPSEHKAVRPDRYGRSMVLEAVDFEGQPVGLFDTKGSGASAADQGEKKNGLATLGEGLREFYFNAIIDSIFAHSREKFRTVGTYGVLDFGFSVIHPDGSQSRAGLIVRQAHQRNEDSIVSNGSYFAPALGMEMTLRQYGLTTSAQWRNVADDRERTAKYDPINVQVSADGAIVDFGSFLFEKFFDRDLVAPDSGDFTISFRDRENFLQVDPKLRLDEKNWGYTESGVADPKQDNPWRWAHGIGEAFFNPLAKVGKAEVTRSVVQQQYDLLVSSEKRRLEKANHITYVESVPKGFTPSCSFPQMRCKILLPLGSARRPKCLESVRVERDGDPLFKFDNSTADVCIVKFKHLQTKLSSFAKSISLLDTAWKQEMFAKVSRGSQTCYLPLQNVDFRDCAPELPKELDWIR
jgi:hypothetical protein